MSIAWLISRMWTNGRHGRPSLSIRITFSVQAWPARSLTTRSKRIRGDAPKAVALRRNVGEKLSLGKRRDVALDEDLALGVGGQRLELGRLGAEAVPGGAVDAARRHVDEALDARVARERCEAHAAEMVDLERDLGIELADGIVRQLRKVDDRVVTPEVLDRQAANVGGLPRRGPIDAVVEPADAMETGVDAQRRRGRGR